jgi:hypothetical protein
MDIIQITGLDGLAGFGFCSMDFSFTWFLKIAKLAFQLLFFQKHK